MYQQGSYTITGLEKLRSFLYPKSTWIPVKMDNDNQTKKVTIHDLANFVREALKDIVFEISTVTSETHSLPPCSEPTVEVSKTDGYGLHFTKPKR